MSALEQFPGRLPVPAAHLARARENQGLAFHLQLSALIGTTAWPQIRHRELKTILELVPGGSLVRLGGLRVGFFSFWSCCIKFMSWQRQETIVYNVATRARRQFGQGL